MIMHLHPHKKFLKSLIGYNLLLRPVLCSPVYSGSAVSLLLLVFDDILTCDQLTIQQFTVPTLW